MRLRYLEVAELAEVSRYLAKYLRWQRAKILGFRLRYLELAELAKVPTLNIGMLRSICKVELHTCVS